MCFVFPFSSTSVLTTLYPGITSDGVFPSLDGINSVSFPSLPTTTNLVSGRTVGVYVAVTGVPFLSTRLTVTPLAFPTKSFSGVNVTLPSLSIVYVPSPGTTTLPSLSAPSSIGATVSSIGTLGFPGLNSGVPVCGCPLGPSDSAGVPSGVTGVTVGVYFAVTGVPFLSTRFTVTPFAVPVNVFSGVNVTVPSGATVYVPSPGIVLVVDPSSNVAGTLSSIGTSGFPGLNSGFPFCSLPWMSVVSAGVPSGVTGVTVGVYLAVTGVPFLSTRFTVTPVPTPVNVFSGVNVTVPSGATV